MSVGQVSRSPSISTCSRKSGKYKWFHSHNLRNYLLNFQQWLLDRVILVNQTHVVGVLNALRMMMLPCAIAYLASEEILMMFVDLSALLTQTVLVIKLAPETSVWTRVLVHVGLTQSAMCRTTVQCAHALPTWQEILSVAVSLSLPVRLSTSLICIIFPLSAWFTKCMRMIFLNNKYKLILHV